MRNDAIPAWPGSRRACTALAIALALGGGAAVAQTSTQMNTEPAPRNAPRAAQPPVSPTQPQAPLRPLQRAAQELRVANQQLGDSSGAASRQAIDRIRLALDQVSQAMGEVPQDQRGALEQRVAQARQALQGDDVRAPQARSAIQQVLDGIPADRASNEGGGAEPMPLSRVSNLIGTNVLGADGKDAGRVENLLIDGNGQVRAAVVEWGGFLGIGARRAVVPMERLQFGAADDRVRMEVTREELEAMPRFEADRLADHGRDGGWAQHVRAYR
jgi:sporulation protein YlmC with PRC-barrel domain